MQNRNVSMQRWLRRGSLVTGLVMMLVSFAVFAPGAAAQGGISLTVDGGTGPITVPVNTNLPLVATGLTPSGTFTYATYDGGDCGLGLVYVQDLEADAGGVWDWASLSIPTPSTQWIRVTDGPNNSNCVQITWEALQATEIPPTVAPTEVPPTEVPATEVPPTEVPPTPTPPVVPPVLSVNGGPGPVTVVQGTSLPIGATGLTPSTTFALAAYDGGDCGLDLFDVFDFEANASGGWTGPDLYRDYQSTIWVRITQGESISNCVQVSWVLGDVETPGPTATATTTPDATATATVTATATMTTTPDPTATAPVTVTPTTEPTGTATTEPTQTPTETVTTTPDPTGTATSTVMPTHAPTKVPTHPATATATSPVSMLPSTGGDAGTGSPLVPGMLLGSGALLLLMAASQVKRISRGTRQ